MLFFTGLHQPSDAGRVPRGFISTHRLRKRRSMLNVPNDWPWIMDSGAFSTISLNGCYPEPPHEYAAEIRRWKPSGNLMAAVSQDYMCEPMMLDLTGLSVADHQFMTIWRYDQIKRAGTADVYLMPVLQGYAPADYVDHIRQYGDRLAEAAWVGVGSVCKRNADPASVEDVLLAIKRERPDLRLHGFGVKTTSLASGIVHDCLYSADSMAWSYRARMEGRNGNDWREAHRFQERIARQPIQMGFLWHGKSPDV